MKKQKAHTKDTPPQDVVVRLPAALREPLEKVAGEERRSLTGQVEKWVSECLAAHASSKAA